MYIRDLSGLKTPIYSCSPFIGKYLVNEKSIPVLSISNGKWHFSKTPILEEVLKFMPFYLKLLDKF